MRFIGSITHTRVHHPITHTHPHRRRGGTRRHMLPPAVPILSPPLPPGPQPPRGQRRRLVMGRGGGGGGGRRRLAVDEWRRREQQPPLPALGGTPPARRAGRAVSRLDLRRITKGRTTARVSQHPHPSKHNPNTNPPSPCVLESGALQVDGPRVRSHACLHALVGRLAGAAQEAAARHHEAVGLSPEQSSGGWAKLVSPLLVCATRMLTHHPQRKTQKRRAPACASWRSGASTAAPAWGSPPSRASPP